LSRCWPASLSRPIDKFDEWLSAELSSLPEVDKNRGGILAISAKTRRFEEPQAIALA
jgi:hypothetical protein